MNKLDKEYLDKDGLDSLWEKIKTCFQPKDADLTAIAALTGTSGLLKKTAANTWALHTSTLVTIAGTNLSLGGSISAATLGGALTKIGTASKGSSNRPIYLDAGTPTAVTSVGEAFLSWGGKNFSGSYAPIDAAVNPVLGANRLAGFKAAGTTIEYSTDGGTTWTDYGLSDANKIALFTTSATVNLAGPSAKAGSTTANNMLRITLDAINGSVYSQLWKWQIYLSTNGSTSCKVKIESYDYNSSTTWHEIIAAADLSGWSGWNVLNFSLPGSGAFGGNNNNTHQRKIRLTFSNASCSTTYAGLQIYKIYAYGGVGWNTPSTLAANGVPYSYDYALNVTFPAKVTASSFSGPLTGNVTGNCSGSSGSCTGNAATATKLTNLTTTDQASSSDTWRRVWMCYTDNANGRPAWSDGFVYQTSTNTLKTKKFLAVSASGEQNEFVAQRTGGSSVALMVGTGNANHGVYSITASKWLIVSDASGEVTMNGNAATATKLTTNAGSATSPVYFSGGVPVACTYTLGKSVPSDAVFTDTHDTNAAGTGISVSGTRGATISINSTYQTYISNGNTAYGWGNHASQNYMHLADAETVTGTKTFSTPDKALFTAGTNAILTASNSNSIAYSPMAYNTWHDHLAFLRTYTIDSVQSTTDGTNWVTSSVDIKPLFAHLECTSKTILATTDKAFRFVLKGTSLHACQIAWFILGVNYTNPFSAFTLTVECSADKSTWTSLSSVSISSSQTTYYLRSTSLPSNQVYLRYTFTKTSNLTTGTVALNYIQALTPRKGNQGLGSEYSYPYIWDANANITPIANNSCALGSSSLKWANVYATTFNGALSGNASSATKATQDGNGNTITSTYLKLSGGTLTGALSVQTSLTINNHDAGSRAHLEFKREGKNFITAPSNGSINFCIGTAGKFSIYSDSVAPDVTNVTDLGSENLKWKDVYANNFRGALIGNANTATKATQDANGNIISSTYLKLAGGTLTGDLTVSAEISARAVNLSSSGSSGYKNRWQILCTSYPGTSPSAACLKITCTQTSTPLDCVFITRTGNVGIGGTFEAAIADGYKLSVDGNVKASGGVVGYLGVSAHGISDLTSVL